MLRVVYVLIIAAQRNTRLHHALRKQIFNAQHVHHVSMVYHMKLVGVSGLLTVSALRALVVKLRLLKKCHVLTESIDHVMCVRQSVVTANMSQHHAVQLPTGFARHVAPAKMMSLLYLHVILTVMWYVNFLHLVAAVHLRESHHLLPQTEYVSVILHPATWQLNMKHQSLLLYQIACAN